MKELTLEEKARAYDKALEKLREFYRDYDTVSCLIDVKEELANLIPELRESEGEKIREELKALVTWVQSYSASGVTGEDAEAMLNWLEMQGKNQKFANKEYTFKAIPRLLEMIQPTDRAKSYCQKLIDSLEQEGYSTDAKIVRERLKLMNGETVAMATMDEQKHTGNVSEWSEEDEVKINRIVACLENLNVPYNDILLKDVAWLKSLKPQPKQEWSEEDERTLLRLIAHFDWNGNTRFAKEDCQEVTNWLKSLRPNHWKPSEEQMWALDVALEGFYNQNDRTALESLRTDLQKLL